MHWLDTSHHKRQSGEYTAKFFVRVDPGNLYSGFSIGQPKDDNDSDANWRALIEWLGIDDHEETLHSIALKNDLTIVEKQRPQSPLLTPIDGGWQAGKKSEETVEKLADFLKSLPADDKILLEFSKPMKKDEALDAGKAIVATFGELFTQLIPIYNGAWS